MHPRKSLSQLLDEHLQDDSSSQGHSEDNEHHNNFLFDGNPQPNILWNSQRNSIGSTLQLHSNLPDTASSAKSDVSFDDDNGRGIGSFFYRESSNRFGHGNGQPSRVNARFIFKNYCKAMVRFNIQPLAEPYLREFISTHNINYDTFRTFIRLSESNMSGLDALKSLITIKPSDTEEQKSFKRAFKIGCEAFLKYFAVNWVFASNIRNKQSYLRQRFLLLRKIKDFSC